MHFSRSKRDSRSSRGRSPSFGPRRKRRKASRSRTRSSNWRNGSTPRLDEIYGRLTPWQRCLIARHPGRPHSTDFAGNLFEEFLPLAGDRAFAEDFAIIGGLVRFRGRSAVFIGQEKGRDTESRIQRNFGMARPEGYRKAIRLMDLADRFQLPVITSIDTPGAYPGRGAEERGQAEAIARTVEKGLAIGVPSVAVILGEGGSGGAVALATASRVLMLEHAVYSVISPEGCASILWRDAEKAESAAAALRLTASDLLELGVIDRIVSEPRGVPTGTRTRRCRSSAMP